MIVTLHDEPVRLRYEAGPCPLPGLKADDLRKAKRGWLHYEGQGISASAPYLSKIEINGVPIGILPGSEGCSEAKDVWSKVMAMELSPQAVQSLKACNRLKIVNTGNDSFKIRHFRIELELADGRKCSSRMETTVYTQPPDWPYGEGVKVPRGNPIESEIPFDVGK